MGGLDEGEDGGGHAGVPCLGGVADGEDDFGGGVGGDEVAGEEVAGGVGDGLDGGKYLGIGGE